MLHLLSTVVVLLVIAGILLRRNPAAHVRVMTAAFLVDLGIVLYIESTRHAIDRVTGPAGPLIWFHAGISTLVLLAYIGQITMGRRMLAGRPSSRQAHIALGVAFCLLRGTNYVTAFMVSGHVPTPVIERAADAHPDEAAPALVLSTTLSESE